MERMTIIYVENAMVLMRMLIVGSSGSSVEKDGTRSRLQGKELRMLKCTMNKCLD
jgi:hypothetical protein